ncbi:MAG: hypothetical protein Q9224_004114 [Gallowayella concinna]
MTTSNAQYSDQGSLCGRIDSTPNLGTEDDTREAASVPLPESIPASSPGSSRASTDRGQTGYAEVIRELQDYMPHLTNVGTLGRAHDTANFDCYDYSNGRLVSRKTWHLTSSGKFPAITETISFDTHVRLLVVNDLSLKLIHALGNSLPINPEVFETHILNAGWRDSHYGDTNSELWNTVATPDKDYVSIEWFRPIHGRRPSPDGKKGSNIFLDPSAIPDSWEEQPSPGRRIIHSTQPLVNLLRMPWEAKLNSQCFSAWQERATVWSTQHGPCRIIVVLLDPSPYIRHHEKVIGATDQFVQNRRPRQTHPRRSASVNDGNRDPEDGRSPRGRFQIPALIRITAWYSRLFKHRVPGSDVVAVAPSTESQSDATSHESTVPSVRASARVTYRYEDIYLFTYSGPRLALMSYSDIVLPKNRPRLLKETEGFRSTAEELKQLSQSRTTREASPPTKVALLENLLMIILSDSLKLLRSIDTTLTKIDMGMLDDAQVQSQIDDWRSALYLFQVTLRSLGTSIPEFAASTLLRRSGNLDTEAGGGTRSCEDLLVRFEHEVAEAQKRTRSTHKSLMTTMSLIESKRGISEAESVTKLTELAFFFIPLTFAASLFSMQIKELDASTTSVGVFLAVATTITLCSYTLRLVIRSAGFLSFWRLWKETIRADRHLQPSTPISTSAVLAWIWERVNTHIWPVYILIPTAAFLTALWTHPLQHGIQVAISTSIALLSLAAVLLLVFIRYDREADF